jgi:alginate O-acetyltransferase complex protein AlgI
MLFTTYEFLLFFIIVCLISFKVKGRIRQVILLFSSIFFYAYGSLVHTPIFIAVVLWTYIIGRMLERSNHRKSVLTIGIIVAFTPLFIYKYIPFLVTQLFPSLSNNLSGLSNIILPIGISFYTFQAVGYLIDVFRKNQKAEHDIIVYGLFITFFPQILSGPIGRSTSLIHQIKENKKVDNSDISVGLRLMALGLFMKVFVADTLGYIVDNAYSNVIGTSGILLLLTTFFFGIQIYCDFNGYSTIAVGSAKILGIELINNFERPYFSKSITEFWRRWHRSLSYWFRDYVFIPLGGSRRSSFRSKLNLFITFLLSGIWHGSNWTYAIWGAFHGIYLIIEKTFGLGAKDKKGWSAKIGWLYTFILVNISWIFFRSDNINDAFLILKKSTIGSMSEVIRLFNGSLSISNIIPISGLYFWKFALGIAGVIIIFFLDVYEKSNGSIAYRMSYFNPILRWCSYILILMITLGFGEWGSSSQFIYFRF